MKILKRGICILILLAVSLTLGEVLRELPVRRADLVAEKYAGWSGVLRVWVCEGWAPGGGSLSRWLSGAASDFEKRNNGVYIQYTYVSREAMAAFAYGTDNPPDLVLFSPGMLDGPGELIKTSLSESLRSELRGYADGYALPVAMGGYAWAVNRRLHEGSLSKEAAFALDPARAAAALAMFTGDSISETDGAPGAKYGLDLGLPVTAETSAPEQAARLAIKPGEDTVLSDNAYLSFINGKTDAIAATQFDIANLMRLSDTGRAPDWEITTTGECFTDQLALAGIVNWPREDLAQRQDLCARFLMQLISEETQAELTAARAFSVAGGAALYPGRQGMEEMERFLTESKLTVPDAFDKRWQTAAKDALTAFVSGGADAETCWQTALRAIAAGR